MLLDLLVASLINSVLIEFKLLHLLLLLDLKIQLFFLLIVHICILLPGCDQIIWILHRRRNALQTFIFWDATKGIQGTLISELNLAVLNTVIILHLIIVRTLSWFQEIFAITADHACVSPIARIFGMIFSVSVCRTHTLIIASAIAAGSKLHRPWGFLLFAIFISI